MSESIPEALLPNSIPDETAYVLTAFLNDLAFVCEEKYYAQTRRYINEQLDDSAIVHECNEALHCKGSNELDDPPF